MLSALAQLFVRRNLASIEFDGFVPLVLTCNAILLALIGSLMSPCGYRERACREEIETV